MLLRVRAASTCGSDLNRFTRGHKVTPLGLGHKATGEIVTAGPGGAAELVGRHAAVIPLVPCFECAHCQAGRYSACKRYSFIGSRQNGGYAGYVELPERNAVLLPDNLPFEAAALIEPQSKEGAQPVGGDCCAPSRAGGGQNIHRVIWVADLLK